MSEVVKIEAPLPAKTPKAPKRAKRLNLELRASLRRNRFDPVHQAIALYPTLEPKLQVQVLTLLINKLVPDLKPIEPDAKPGSKSPSTNIQINVPSSTTSLPSRETASGSPSSLSLEDLYAIAASTSKPDASE